MRTSSKELVHEGLNVMFKPDAVSLPAIRRSSLLPRRFRLILPETTAIGVRLSHARRPSKGGNATFARAVLLSNT